MIQNHETECFELKTSFSVHSQEGNDKIELELVLAKEIIAFLNSRNGGYLCLGVKDNCQIVGLCPDYEKIKNKNSDKWKRAGREITKRLFRDTLELAINQNIRNYIYGDSEAFNLNMRFYEFDGKDVCLIKLIPQKEPIYFKKTRDPKEVEFMVRVGTSKKSLNIPESVKYIQDNFNDN